MTTSSALPSTRRKLLAAGGAGLLATALGGIAMPAFAQKRTMKFTLPWLAEGASIYVFVAKEMGFLARRGFDIEISRGFGSVTAAQTIAAGKFDIGTVGAPAQVMSVAQGLPLYALGVVEYDAAMGIGLPVDSPIRKPGDLVGKRIGGVPTSAEYPFFPAFCKRAGVDISKIDLIQLDSKVRERALIDRQVDGVLGIAGSILPVVMAQGAKARFMLYRSVDIQTYGSCITVAKKTFDTDPAMCEALVDGLMEGMKYTLLNPQEAKEIFYKAVPEITLSPNGKTLTDLGLGIHQLALLQDEPRQNGLGWGEAKTFDAMAQMVMDYVAKPGMTKPKAEQLFTNRFAGRVKLSAAEWAKVEESVKSYRALLS